jgi:hypothetical protein
MYRVRNITLFNISTICIVYLFSHLRENIAAKTLSCILGGWALGGATCSLSSSTTVAESWQNRARQTPARSPTHTCPTGNEPDRETIHVWFAVNVRPDPG